MFGLSEGEMEHLDLLGGKRASLAEMTRLGLPVPRGVWPHYWRLPGSTSRAVNRQRDGASGNSGSSTCPSPRWSQRRATSAFAWDSYRRLDPGVRQDGCWEWTAPVSRSPSTRARTSGLPGTTDTWAQRNYRSRSRSSRLSWWLIRDGISPRPAGA